jgi:heterodisulfide reductase subunit A2
MTVQERKGVNFIHGRVSRIDEDPETHNLIVHSEDQTLGQPIEIEAEMVVLATAAIPKKGSDEIARILNFLVAQTAFSWRATPSLSPWMRPPTAFSTLEPAKVLKDIPFSVSQGSGAAVTCGNRYLEAEVED